MKYFFKICFILFPVFAMAQQDPYVENWTDTQIDSLRFELKHTTNDTMRMRISRSIAIYLQETNRDSSIYFQKKQLKLARKLKLKLWEADALDGIGWLLAQSNNYPLSLQNFFDGIAILQNKDCEKNIYLISLFAKDKKPETARLTCLAWIYNDLSQLYKATGNYKKELSYLFKSYSIGKSINNYTVLALAGSNISYVYLKLKKPDLALKFAEESLINMDKSGYKTYKGTTLNNIGTIYLGEKNYAKAQQYFEKSLVVYQVNNNKTGIPNTYISMADLFKSKGKIDSSIYYTQKALAGYKEVNLPTYKNRAYDNLYQLYKSKGNSDSAFYYLQLYKTLNDSLTIAEKQKINEYQNLGFNEQIKTQKKEQDRIQKENTTRTYILITGIAVFMLIAFLLFRNNRNRRKANELLLKQKKEIELQKNNVETTLSDLKATQSQLIQSEKMASLGELTAGIAHEIQNPLNFVNNFSEVSAELLSEMKEELEKGNTDDAKEIADDVIQNLEKINHHGKRADAIVKGMLQHSRSSSGIKEPTDLNALCDEYLRLSYHGLRAKDKSFNATIKTDFDESIGKINIIPQDFGRVILNLLTNAFYAVNEKKNLQTNEGKIYEPTVSIATKKEKDKIIVTVTDNGNGMPQEIIDKIFQPFFTTKPTGKGTGLGLSMSYDIITKGHGGELKVNTEENIGSEFIILLPIN